LRIVTYNDLHLEFGSGWLFPPEANGDVPPEAKGPVIVTVNPAGGTPNPRPA
jgi:hypothetical protein